MIPHDLKSLDKLWNLDKHRIIQPWGVKIQENRAKFLVEPESVVALDCVVASGVIHDDAEALRVTFNGTPAKVSVQGGDIDSAAAVTHVVLSVVGGRPPYALI